MCKNLEVAIKAAERAMKAGNDGKIELDFQIRLETADKIADELSRKKEVAKAEEIRESNLRAFERAQAFLGLIEKGAFEIDVQPQKSQTSN